MRKLRRSRASHDAGRRGTPTARGSALLVVDAVVEIDLVRFFVRDGGEQLEAAGGVAGKCLRAFDRGDGVLAGDDDGAEREEVFIDDIELEELGIGGGATF